MEENKDILSHIQPKKINVPDSDYFEQLAMTIDQGSKAKIRPLYKHPVFIGGIAAAIVGIAFFIFNPFQQQVDPINQLASIPSENIYAYVSENIDDFEEEEIAVNLSSDQLQTIETSSVMEETATITINDLSPEEIQLYFESEGIDYEEIDEESFI